MPHTLLFLPCTLSRYGAAISRMPLSEWPRRQFIPTGMKWRLWLGLFKSSHLCLSCRTIIAVCGQNDVGLYLQWITAPCQPERHRKIAVQYSLRVLYGPPRVDSFGNACLRVVVDANVDEVLKVTSKFLKKKKKESRWTFPFADMDASREFENTAIAARNTKLKITKWPVQNRDSLGCLVGLLKHHLPPLGMCGRPSYTVVDDKKNESSPTCGFLPRATRTSAQAMTLKNVLPVRGAIREPSYRFCPSDFTALANT